MGVPEEDLTSPDEFSLLSNIEVLFVLFIEKNGYSMYLYLIAQLDCLIGYLYQ
jgi:hypothetical protein